MKRTCSIDDCPKPARARGWCVKHYQRWQTHGDPLMVKVRLPDREPKPKGPCAINECDGRAEIRGWCSTHYHRWHRTGDPLAPDRRFSGRSVCTVIGCEREQVGRGWCNAHYMRARRWGTPTPTPRTPEVRFFERVSADEGGCWNFSSCRSDGYGRFSIGRTGIPAHRWSYEFFRAEIPDGLVIDHLCENRACVNPWHLDPVPPLVNLIRTLRRDPKDRAPA